MAGVKIQKNRKFHDMWAFVFVVLLTTTFEIIGVIEYAKAPKIIVKDEIRKNTVFLVVLNILTLLFTNTATLLLFIFATKQLIYASFVCASVVSFGMLISAIISKKSQSSIILGIVACFFSVIGSIGAYLLIRNTIDTVCSIISHGARIIVRHLFKILFVYVLNIGICAFLAALVLTGIGSTENKNVFSGYFIFWIFLGCICSSTCINTRS